MAERGRRGKEGGRKEEGGKSGGDRGRRSNVFSSLSMEILQSLLSWGRGVGERRRWRGGWKVGLLEKAWQGGYWGKKREVSFSYRAG